jgi:hypothetical protein
LSKLEAVQPRGMALKAPPIPHLAASLSAPLP